MMLTPARNRAPGFLELGGRTWNQVAVIQPSSCHTVAKRCQSPESLTVPSR